MVIGVTERGDPSIDPSWYRKMPEVDGAIIISKNLHNPLRNLILDYADKIIVHATCTGYGGTVIEPNVPDTQVQIQNIANLIDEGFSPNQIVLRIDPLIFCSKSTYTEFLNVLESARKICPQVKRVRISILDEYKHVHGRFQKESIEIYKISDPILSLISRTIDEYYDIGYTFEACAEPLINNKHVKHIGCVSKRDLDILGISYSNKDIAIRHFQRKECNCISCKKELLTSRKRCPNGCLYCYWKD